MRVLTRGLRVVLAISGVAFVLVAGGIGLHQVHHDRTYTVEYYGQLFEQSIASGLASGEISEAEIPAMRERARIEVEAAVVYGRYGPEAEEEYLLGQGFVPVPSAAVEHERERLPLGPAETSPSP